MTDEKKDFCINDTTIKSDTTEEKTKLFLVQKKD